MVSIRLADSRTNSYAPPDAYCIAVIGGADQLRRGRRAAGSKRCAGSTPSSACLSPRRQRQGHLPRRRVRPPPRRARRCGAHARAPRPTASSASSRLASRCCRRTCCLRRSRRRFAAGSSSRRAGRSAAFLKPRTLLSLSLSASFRLSYPDAASPSKHTCLRPGDRPSLAGGTGGVHTKSLHQSRLGGAAPACLPHLRLLRLRSRASAKAGAASDWSRRSGQRPSGVGLGQWQSEHLIGQRCASEAASSSARGSGSPWKRRASQSCQACPEEAWEPT